MPAAPLAHSSVSASRARSEQGDGIARPGARREQVRQRRQRDGVPVDGDGPAGRVAAPLGPLPADLDEPGLSGPLGAVDDQRLALLSGERLVELGDRRLASDERPWRRTTHDLPLP